MKNIRGVLPFLGIVFSQVAAATVVISLMELILNRLNHFSTASWQFYLIHVLILLPCAILITPSGYCSDKYPKEKVLRITSILLFLVTFAFVGGFAIGNVALSMVAFALFFSLQAIQSTAKNAIIKELVGVKFLSVGTSSAYMVTFVSLIVAAGLTAFGFEKLAPASAVDFTQLAPTLMPIAASVAGLELLSILFSLGLPSIGCYDAEMKFPWKRYYNLGYTRRKLRKAWSNRSLRQSIIGLSMFWVMIFLLLFVARDMFSTGSLFREDSSVNYAIVGVVAGLIVGCYYARRMCKHFVEMGLIPMGTAGAAILIFLIPFIPRPYNSIALALLGFCGGLYVIPMFTMLIYNTKPRSAGHVLAISNGVQNLCILIFYFLVTCFMNFMGVSRMNLFFVLGIVCLAATVWALWAMPQTLLRQLMRSVLSVHYKFLVHGADLIPWEGPVLLVGNHISYIDWALIQMASPRRLRFVMTKRPFEKWYIRLLLSQMNTIDLDIENPEKAMADAHDALLRGEAVVMFPENVMTSTGNMNRFRLDYSSALKDVPKVKLMPFYVQGLWGSAFSQADDGLKQLVHSGGRIITVSFGEELPLDASPVAVKRMVQELSITAWESSIRQLRPLPSAWIRTVKQYVKSGPAIYSLDGNHFSGYKLATAVFSFGGLVEKLTKGEKNVGLLIPPSAPGLMMNMACQIRAKTVLNLNYTNTPDVMNYCCETAEVKTIITAKAFIDKLKQKGLDMDSLLKNYKVYYMEDLKGMLKKSTLVLNLLRTVALPAWYLEKRFIKKVSLDDVATIIFSSGSEGRPKGVELTHFNLMGNIKQCESALNLVASDVFLGSLPMFHAFGFCVTTMLCMVEGVPVVPVPDPTDARLIGRVCAQYKVSILLATGTFLRMWGVSKYVHPLMFSHVRNIFAGAEKIREDVRQLYRTKFKLEIFEGFGCTETTPVSAVNTKDVLMDDWKTVLQGNKPGTVGAPLPGTQFRIVDPDTMEELPVGEDGLILAGGAQIMKGYLKDPERTNQAIAVINGKRWYKTGDKGHVDDDGYLTIVDRYSRFAKIGGEMVSLGSVDFKISETNYFDGVDHFTVPVPDGAKGEKIALLFAGDITEDEARDRIRQVGLPPLMVPAYVIKVDDLPKLGSGKSDFQTGKKIAKERLGLS